MKIKTCNIFTIILIFLIGILCFAFTSCATDLTHSLSKIEISPQEAAKIAKYSGPIDSAYKIGGIIVIVSDRTHHAFGNDGEEELVLNTGEVGEYLSVYEDGNNNKASIKPTSLGWEGMDEIDAGCENEDGGVYFECIAEKRFSAGRFDAAMWAIAITVDHYYAQKVLGANVDEKIKQLKEKLCVYYHRMIDGFTQDEIERYVFDVDFAKRSVLKYGNDDCDL